MNGTTRCPHCETRFRITDAQFAAHQGSVRCGQCMQAFDSRPTYIPDQPQVAQPISEVVSHTVNVSEVVEHGLIDEPDAFDSVAHEDVSAQPVAEHRDVEAITEPTVVESGEFHLSLDESLSASIEPIATPQESHDTLDFSQLTVTPPAAEGASEDAQPYSAPLLMAESSAVEGFNADLPVEAKRRTWPWAVGALVSALLLLAQSAYFFRVNLAAHLPALKPALVGYCYLLNCTVPLPQNAELISIESSGLEADPEHENQIAFSALLRNRASYALAFPVLALTLNDNQDTPVARRFFMPGDYLPAGESVQTGFLVNHEANIRLRLNTADLRPAGYRLELFYLRN